MIMMLKRGGPGEAHVRIFHKFGMYIIANKHNSVYELVATNLQNKLEVDIYFNEKRRIYKNVWVNGSFGSKLKRL